VSSCPVIVRDVAGQDAAQVRFTKGRGHDPDTHAGSSR
jgi:hypothetical protein